MHLNIVIITLMISFSICLGKNATDSTLITIDKLEFSSEYEKKQFTEYDKSKIFNSIYFLLALDTSMTEAKSIKVKQQLDKYFSELKNGANGKSTDKTLKYIFSQIHDKLLTKYTIDSRFDKLLDAGEYNCVTASALYAMAFDELKINYQLRSTPNHVYVIALPGPNQFVIETTNPQSGVIRYSEEYQEKYVSDLLKQKLVTKQEIETLGVNQLFDKFFNASDTINLKELVAFHYYNHGISYLEKEDYKKANVELKKALYLYPTSQIKYILFASLGAKLGQSFNITDVKHVEEYFLYFSLSELAEKELSNFFELYREACDELAIRKDNIEKLDSITNIIITHLNEEEQRDKFLELYYISKSINASYKENIYMLYINAFKAKCINDKNLAFKKMYNDLFGYPHDDFSFDDVDSIFSVVQKFTSKCDSIFHTITKNNLRFFTLGKHYEKEDVLKAEKILLDIESKIKPQDSTYYDVNFLEYAFKYAFRYYYTRYDFESAKKIIKRGLTLAPNNAYLKETLQYVSQFNSSNYNKPTIENYKYYPPLPPTPSKNNLKSNPPRTVIIKGGK